MIEYRPFLLGKSYFLPVLAAYVCECGLPGLFDDRILATLLGKSCSLVVRCICLPMRSTWFVG